ncbi:MAG: hypothetical protein ACYTDX_04150 [Planctomycetota bacterium]|jgi:hypothetical protein
MIRTLALLVTGLAFAAPASAGSEEVTVGQDVGQIHPNYAFPTLASPDITSLSDFLGTKVLLVQFASW